MAEVSCPESAQGVDIPCGEAALEIRIMQLLRLDVAGAALAGES